MSKVQLRSSLWAVCLLAVFGSAAAQDFPAALRALAEKADVVIEGEVCRQESFADELSGHIRTANIVSVKTAIKGVKTDTLVILTEGGQLEGRVQVHSHSPKLSLGQSGIFMLQAAKQRWGSGAPCYELAGGNSGIVCRLTSDRDKEAYYPGTGGKAKSWRAVREEIGLWCGKDFGLYQAVDRSSQSSELCIKLANAVPLFPQQQVQFDVYAKSSVPGLAFAGMKLLLDYPTAHIPSNIVSAGGLSVSKETITVPSIYQLSAQDATESRVEVEISTSCFASPDYYLLDTVYEKLVRIVVDVSGWGDLGAINLESFVAQGTAEHYVPGLRCQPFGKVCGEGEVPLNPCEVTSISAGPLAGGIGQAVTISGSGFGGNVGVFAEVYIPNADNGGNTRLTISGGPFAQPRYFDSWTDTEIKIKLASFGPGDSPFGSGEWEINPDARPQSAALPCFTDVEIDYALLNRTTSEGSDKMIGIPKSPAVVDQQTPGDGAHKWYIDGGINSDPDLQQSGITFAKVEEIALQAYCDWSNATGIETIYMGALSGNLDEKNVLLFADLPAGIAADANRSFTFGACSGQDPVFTGRITWSHIQMNKNKDWFISSSSNENDMQSGQLDFYSVLMHEIGHSFGHQHAMDLDDNQEDDARLMYWAVRPKQIKRGVDAAASSGTSLLALRTLESINTSGDCFNGFALSLTGGCTTNAAEQALLPPCSIQVGTLVRSGEPISIDFQGQRSTRWALFDSQGRLVAENSRDRSGTAFNIPTKGLPAGVYFLAYFCNGLRQADKIVVH